MRNLNDNQIQSIKKLIDSCTEALVVEAELKDFTNFISDDAMYEQFKFNADYEEEFANKFICKYFLAKMHIKILYLMIDEYRFTEQDLAMLRYFSFHKTGLGLNRKAFSFSDTSILNNMYYTVLYEILRHNNMSIESKYNSLLALLRGAVVGFYEDLLSFIDTLNNFKK